MYIYRLFTLLPLTVASFVPTGQYDVCKSLQYLLNYKNIQTGVKKHCAKVNDGHIYKNVSFNTHFLP